MDRDQISDFVHRLNDIELAILLCLVANGHCILTTEESNLARLEQEVELIGSNAFGLSVSTVQCHPDSTLDEFVGALFVSEEPKRSPSFSITSLSPLDTADPYCFRRAVDFGRATDGGGYGGSNNRKFRTIANVIVVRNMNGSSLEIQSLVLELARSRRVSTRTFSVLEAPETFLLIVLLPKITAQLPLFNHLREEFFISHYHSFDPEEKTLTQEVKEALGMEESDVDSLASVVVRKASPSTPVIPLSHHRHPFQIYPPLGGVLVPCGVITQLKSLTTDVKISTEVKRYMMDIVVFLRMHRAVFKGVSARATRNFELFVKCLAPLHGLDFVTPALVSLAVFKVYTHRIEIVRKAEDERSVNWGSRPEAVEMYLRQMDVESVIEDVLDNVAPPL